MEVLISKIDPSWIAAINAVNPNWLILLWVICAVVGMVIFVLSCSVFHDKHDHLDHPYFLISASLWIVAGAAMMALNPGVTSPGESPKSVLWTLILWTKIIVPLYLFMAYPILAEFAKMLSKTKLYKWVIE